MLVDFQIGISVHLKLLLFRQQHYHEFLRFFLCLLFQRHYEFPNSSAPQVISKRARDLFIMIDPLIICINFRGNQLPFSLSISTAASQIREKLVITPVYLKLRSRFMQLSLHSQNSGYTLFQLFQDTISHEEDIFPLSSKF